jgi:Domain of unknown function (DUF222)
MARQLDKVPASVDLAGLETELLEQAKISTPGRFWHFTKRLIHSLNAELVAAEQRIQAELRWLRFADMDDGTVMVSGQLDPIGAAAVKSMREPLSHRMGEGDDRNLERRRGDALVEGAVMLLDSGRLPHVATQRPQLQVTTTLETLSGKPGAPAAEMEFSEPVATPTVQRLACDLRPRIHHHRRGTRAASRLGCDAPRPQCPRSALPVARVRASGSMERGAPPGALGRGRSDRSLQPHLALPPPSLDGARRRMETRSRKR